MRIPIVVIAATLGCALVATTSGAQGQRAAASGGQGETAQERRNVEALREFWREGHQEFHGDAALKYLAPAYVEHNNGGINGNERMAQIFGHPPPLMRQMKTISQTVYALGPFVFLHQHRRLPDAAHPGETTDTDIIEMIRVSDGLLQEHWMFFPAGHTPPMQPQTQEENQAIAVVQGFWHDVWEGRDGNAVPKYVDVGYIEHGAGEANGRDAVVKRFGHPRAAGAPQVSVQSQTVYARGPFVILHQQRKVSDPSQPQNSRTLDLLEMFEVYNGLLQEHWTIYPVPGGPAASWGE